MERIQLTKDKRDSLLDQRRYIDHLDRYLNIRRFMYGNVLDFGCGIGYGSNLLAENPDVRKVVGYEINTDTLETARKTYQDVKIAFTGNILDIHKELHGSVDIITALEVIEHLLDPEDFIETVNYLDPNILIVSFPNKPSVKYNKFHFYDYNKQQIVDMFPRYMAIKSMTAKDVTIILFVKAPVDMPNETYSNLLDIWNG